MSQKTKLNTRIKADLKAINRIFDRIECLIDSYWKQDTKISNDNIEILQQILDMCDFTGLPPVELKKSDAGDRSGRRASPSPRNKAYSKHFRTSRHQDCSILLRRPARHCLTGQHRTSSISPQRPEAAPNEWCLVLESSTPTMRSRFPKLPRSSQASSRAMCAGS